MKYLKIRLKPAVVTRYVPVGVRPRRSPPPQLHWGDQRDKEEKGEKEQETARGGEGKKHPAGVVWRVFKPAKGGKFNTFTL